MKSLMHTLAVLSALAATAPVMAHPRAHALPRHAQAFSAVVPRDVPADNALRLSPFGTADDSHDTATGGPVGGLGS